MSTKQQTTSTNTYNKASMNAFNAMQPQIQKGLSDYMDTSKMQNAWMQQANQQIGQVGNRMNSNLTSNMRAGGWGGGNVSPFMQASIARNGRAVSGMQGNAFLNTLFRTDDNKKWAIGNMAQYHPLQTGGTQTQTTSGTGTWLPQLAGAAISAGVGVATGGMSTLAQGIMKPSYMPGGGAFATAPSGGSFFGQVPGSFSGGGYPIAPGAPSMPSYFGGMGG